MRGREANGSAIPVALVPIHTAVAGRARISVGGLTGCASTARLLERGLAVHSSVKSALASELTGNVTVLFDATTELDGILEHMAAVLRGKIVSGRLDDDHPEWHTVGSAEAAAHLKTSLSDGLSGAEAARQPPCWQELPSCRLRRAGFSKLPPSPLSSVSTA